MFSASATMASRSSKLSSGLAYFTISTLSNWCTRMSPRVSRPALPASSRKHGVNAQYFSGSWPASRTSPAWMFVSCTSAVGMRYRPSVVWNRSSSNFGSWPVPVSVSALAMAGHHHSL